MNNTLPMTTTRSARRCTRYVIGGGDHLAKVKPLARRKERRNRRQQDHCGNYDASPSLRGVTGRDVC